MVCQVPRKDVELVSRRSAGWVHALNTLYRVIGEPTGTSLKFTTMMVTAVKKFFEDRGVDSNELRICPMPLEGEGTIEHRVDR